MKIIFFGSPEFAATQLETLVQDPEITICSVITQPDKPVGRKQIKTAPKVKEIANKHGLKVLQPKSKKELSNMLEGQTVDLFVVIAFGMILPKAILKIPKHGAINVHASLLPKYRGASPIQESLLNGDKESGISIIKIDEELDHGPIFLLKRINIENMDNTETLSKRMALLSAKLLPATIKDIVSGNIHPIKQKHEDATYCRKIKKSDGKINWGKSAKEIFNMVRAYNPWPIAYTEVDGKTIKINEADFEENKQKNLQNGQFFTNNGILKIKTESGNLIPKILQPEGKNPMDSKSFLNGHQKLIIKQ